MYTKVTRHLLQTLGEILIYVILLNVQLTTYRDLSIQRIIDSLFVSPCKAYASNKYLATSKYVFAYL